MKPFDPDATHTSRPHRRRIVTLLNGLAAVLVVGAIIGASLLVFTRHAPSASAPPSLPDGNVPGLTTVASSAVDALTMSLAITPGPYYLSEMLAVKLTLTNHAQRSYYPGLPFTGSTCGYYPGIGISGGGKPEFTIPIAFVHSCPFMPAHPVTLKRGQSISIIKYAPLQQSGRLTLFAPVNFYAGPAPKQIFPGPVSIPSPFGEHGITARINVNPAIPADRHIPFEVQGYYAIVQAPKSARGPLLYAYSIGCHDYNNDGGTTWTGNFGWDTLTNAKIQQPGCPGKNPQWSFAFAVPGYAVAVGSNPPGASG